MLGLKLMHVSKRGHWVVVPEIAAWVPCRFTWCDCRGRKIARTGRMWNLDPHCQGVVERSQRNQLQPDLRLPLVFWVTLSPSKWSNIKFILQQEYTVMWQEQKQECTLQHNCTLQGWSGIKLTTKVYRNYSEERIWGLRNWIFPDTSRVLSQQYCGMFL